MIDAQLVTGATQEMRIFTGSAACAALAPRSAAAATLANTNLDRRMGVPPAGCFRGFGPIYAQRGRAAAVLASAEMAHAQQVAAVGCDRARARPPPAPVPWFRPRRR